MEDNKDNKDNISFLTTKRRRGRHVGSSYICYGEKVCDVDKLKPIIIVNMASKRKAI